MTHEYSQSDRVIPLNIHGTKTPLFLVHGVKGQAFICPHFLSLLGDDQPVYAFHGSGLNRSNKQYCSVPEMAKQYMSAMCQLQSEGPYIIGAIAIGSVVAVEMAQQLVDAGVEVAPLLLIDPPVLPPGERSWFKRKKQMMIERIQGKSLVKKFHQKTAKDFQRITDHGRIALDITNPEAVKKACQVAYDFRLALNNHQMKPYFGEVHLLGSRRRLSKAGPIRAKLQGKVTTYEIGEDHDDIHDTSNERFGQQLKKSMAAIGQSIGP